VKIRELVTLGSLDPNRLFVVVETFCGHLGAPNLFVGCASRLL
jgi:hypothetical protein